EVQGKILAREWLHNLANGIALSIWYDWHDDSPDAKDPQAHFGIVRYRYDGSHHPVYRPKPAYHAAQTLTATLNGYRFHGRLGVGKSGDYVVLFRRNRQVGLAVWTAAQTPHKISIPARAGRFRVTAHAGEKLKTITAGNVGLS